MGTCCAVLGLICLVLTNLAAIIAFATPYWLKLGQFANRGLWAYCDSDTCTWVFQEAPAFLLEQGSTWWRATQGLMCVGLSLTLFALLVATVALCCQCKGCNSSHVVTAVLIIAFLVLGVTVTVFGVCANYYMSVDIDTVYRYAWSFWLTAAAAGLALFTAIIYALEGSNRYSYDQC